MRKLSCRKPKAVKKNVSKVRKVLWANGLSQQDSFVETCLKYYSAYI